MPHRPINALPQTSQTSYSNYDSGWYRAGHGRSGSSRWILGTGDRANTVRDTVTGLMWVRQPSLIFPDGSGQVGDDFGGGSSSARGAWVTTGDDYVKGDLVSNGGLNYICKTGNTPTAENAPGVCSDTWITTPWAGNAADADVPAQVAWGGAIANCYNLNYCGFDDWRVPSLLEMMTIIDFDENYHRPYSEYFPNAPYYSLDYGGQVNKYWTGDTWKVLSDRALVLNLDATQMTISYYDKVTYSNYLMPVRGSFINGPGT